MKDNTNSTNNEHLLLKEIIFKLPFSDFDETLMKRIHLEAAKQKALQRDKTFSFIFFILATCFGLIINAILLKSDYSIFSISPNTTSLLFQFLFLFFFLFQFEKFLPHLDKINKLRIKT